MHRSIASIIAIAGLALPILVTGCTGQKGSDYDRLQSSYDSLALQSEKNQADLNEAIAIIDEVENNLKEISAAERRVETDALTGELNQPRKQQIMDEIAILRQTLQENKKDLAEQQEKLKRNGINLSALNKKIQSLTEEIAEKDQLITTLRTDLDSVRVVVAQRDSALSEESERTRVKDATIAIQSRRLEEQDAELHTGYYCFGNLDELKVENIIKGGGLFSKAKVLPEGFNQDYFTKVDTRDLTMIALFAPKARLRTDHPASSYHFEEDGDGNQTLIIDKQSDFWSRSKYLVIEVE